MKIEDVEEGQIVRLLGGGIALKQYTGQKGKVIQIEYGTGPEDDESAVYILLECNTAQYELPDHLELVCV